MGAGEELVLTAPTAPRVLRGPYVPDQAVRDAMNAALAGNFGALDHLERTYLNLMVRIGDLCVRDANGAPHWWFDLAQPRALELRDRGFAPFVVDYHRGGEARLEWAMMPVCRRCVGRLRRLACSVCGGDWYVGESLDALILTTVEGLIVVVDGVDEPAVLDEEEALEHAAIEDWEGA
jgi:hypothetical protein